MARRTIKNQNGNAMIIALVLAAITAGSVLVISSVQTRNENFVRTLQLKEGTGIVTDVVASVIRDDWSWRATVMANADMSCLDTNGSSCGSRNTFAPFVLKTADGTDFIPAGQGLDYTGSLCATGTPQCIFEVQTFWRCKNDPCETTEKINLVSSAPALVIEYRVRPAAGLDADLQKRINWDKLVLQVPREKGRGTLSETCQQIGGYFDNNNENCDILRATPRCAHGQYVRSINAAGEPQCSTIQSLHQRCRSKSAIVGFNAAGEFVCDYF